MNKKSFVTNCIITVFVFIGAWLTFFVHDDSSMLITDGIENLKYYTVLSNILAGIVAFISVIQHVQRKSKKQSVRHFLAYARLVTATAVTVTFLTIGLFLGPLYGYSKMYRNANFFFHLVVPLLVVIDLLFFEDDREYPFGATMAAAAVTFAYGVFYLVNIFINGIGEWPDSNDWYGFLNWGFGVGMIIFACITLFSWLISLLLRVATKKTHRQKEGK